LTEVLDWLAADGAIAVLLNYVAGARLVEIFMAIDTEQALTYSASLSAGTMARLCLKLREGRETPTVTWLTALNELRPLRPNVAGFVADLGPKLRWTVAVTLGPQLPDFLQMVRLEDVALMRRLHTPEHVVPAGVERELFQREPRFAALTLMTLPQHRAAATLDHCPVPVAETFSLLDPKVAAELFLLMRNRNGKQRLLSDLATDAGVALLRQSGADAAGLLATTDGDLLRKYRYALEFAEVVAAMQLLPPAVTANLLADEDLHTVARALSAMDPAFAAAIAATLPTRRRRQVAAEMKNLPSAQHADGTAPWR
jgi:hypothetical protein